MYPGMLMDYSKLPNKALIHLCGHACKDRGAWAEFYTRFNDRIRLAVYRECKNKIHRNRGSQFSQVVQDIVQDVYVKLVSNEAKALKDFKGTNENSIYLYLGVIAKNAVRNHVVQANAQKRPSIEKSLDEPLYPDSTQNQLVLHDRLHPIYSNIDEEIMFKDLHEEIIEVIEKAYSKKDRERNKIIFKLYFYEGFSAENIATQFGYHLSVKRVSNLISDIKNLLQEKLIDRIPDNKNGKFS